MQIGVVGAGIGGLCAACELAKDGHQVTVYEKNEAVGGKMSEVLIDGFRFDTGPSLLTMPHLLDELFTYCGHRRQDYYQTLALDPLCRYVYPDGFQLNSYTDRSKALLEIEKISSTDTQAYLDFLEYASTLYQRTTNAFLLNPLADWADLKHVRWSDLLKIDAFTSVSDRVDAMFRSEHLRSFFKRFTTYNGSNPWKAPATLNVIPHIELNQGGYYVDGGMYRIAQSLQQLAVSLGVRFQFNAKVERMLTAQKNITGLQINGENVAFDLIVSNADATFTHTQLIEDRVLDPTKKQRIAQVEPSSSGFVILLGLNKTYPSLAHHNIFFSSDYKKEFQDIFDRGRLPEDPTIYVTNTSLTDPNDAPAGGSNWFILVNTPWVRKNAPEPDYEAYADKIILCLTQHGLRGIQEHTVVRKLIRPQEFESRWNSNRGSIYGTSSNHRTSAFIRPRNRSPFVKNLYLVGGSTHPGGGIPLVTLSARHACTLIRRDHPSTYKV
jgi:phytoene desaturase